MLTVLPKFSGENPNEFFSTWATRFTNEANSLTPGKKLGALVLPRLLTGKANEKYLSLTPADKADAKKAMERLGALLRTPSSQNKAMNELALIRKKESENMFKYAKRVEGQIKAFQGLPAELRKRVKEKGTPETLNKAIETAETLEDILKEEDNETVHLIERINQSDKDQRLKNLEKQVEQLRLENERLSEWKKPSENHQNSFQQRWNNNNFRQGRNQNNFGKQYQSNQNDHVHFERSKSPGWQINRSPRTTGINFLMLVAISSMLFQTISAQMQICPNERSGEYFAPPTTTVCKLDKEEKILKTTVKVFTEFGASMKKKAYRCSRNEYKYCMTTFWFREPEYTVEDMKGKPMSEKECNEAIQHHTVGNKTLLSKGNHLFQTEADNSGWWSLTTGKKCDNRHIFTLEMGEISTPDGETVISALGDLSGCEAKNGTCDTIDSRVVWEKEGIRQFCKYSFVQSTVAYITKTKVALPELQMALEIEKDQKATGAQCVPNLNVILNNGFIISIDSSNHTLDELIKEVSEKPNRVKRSGYDPENSLIQRLFGQNATHGNYPYFSVDPIFDPRILEEMRRFSVTFTEIKFQWENYDLPNKQTAVLRAIKEAEYRNQMIRELRKSNDGNRNAALIKEMEEPTHRFDSYLIQEFGNTRILSPEERQRRKWNTGPATTRHPFLREQAEKEFLKRISEEARRATEAKGNAQLNSRVQYVTNRITETNYLEFDRVYHKLCELQNSQIEIAKAILTIDPTLGMRNLLGRDDIVARRAGTVYIVTPCRNVTVEKIHLNHRINQTCYRDTPVTVQNQTWFVAPGMSRDLIKESLVIPCEEVTLGVYQNEKGEWYSHNGIATIRKIGIQFSKRPEKQNLTLSAPPAFAKLENVENPTTYLIAHLNTIIRLRENQATLAKTLERSGMKNPELDSILKNGVRAVSTIAEDIQSGIEKGRQFLQDTVLSLLKNVVAPIVTVIAIAGIIIILMKFYFVRKATGTALTRLVKLARRAPPSVQTLMRRMEPEINNINLSDDDEPIELDVFHMEHRRSLISMPEINSIVTVGGGTDLPLVPIHLNGIPTISNLGSGSSISLIAEKVLNQLGLKDKIIFTECSARVANGSTLKFKGKVQIVITIGKTSTTHTFLVVENEKAPAECLLGVDFIMTMNILEKEVTFNIPERYVKVGEDKLKLLDPSRIGHEQNVRNTNFQQGEKVVIQEFTAGKLEHRFSPPAVVLDTTESRVNVRNNMEKVTTVHKNQVKRYFTMKDLEPKAEEQMDPTIHLIKHLEVFIQTFESKH